MIVLSNTTAQTLAVGQSLVFDTVVIRTGCAECHRPNTNSVKLRSKGVYGVQFSGNVTNTATAASVELHIQLGGETLPETRMEFTPTAAGSVGNVSTATAVANCCGDYDRITVTNTGDVAITIGANSALFVRRLS